MGFKLSNFFIALKILQLKYILKNGKTFDLINQPLKS